ncbi:MAG: hypothetical protein CVV05_13045 [Gammaproteobacteria bacterium HGW-Gammaproteobacteria-1]|nr:MAG: hypothetical protein CVV05_13045 [Gammaproteobacteria bacterium HGW-Gammaproteobacteria-1]
MTKYYVNTNAQDSGDHEVHEEGCSFMPAPQHQKYLGNFTNCHDAVREARKYYPSADGCFYCSKACHSS